MARAALSSKPRDRTVQRCRGRTPDNSREAAAPRDMADMPDLSHLTPEERAIIEGVMMRQRQEEQREHEVMRCDRGQRPFKSVYHIPNR